MMRQSLPSLGAPSAGPTITRRRLLIVCVLDLRSSLPADRGWAASPVAMAANHTTEPGVPLNRTLADSQIPYPSGTDALTCAPDTSFYDQDRFTFTASEPYSTSDPISVIIEVITTPAAQPSTNAGEQQPTGQTDTDNTTLDNQPHPPFALLPPSCAPVGSGVAITTLLWGILIAARPMRRGKICAPRRW